MYGTTTGRQPWDGAAAIEVTAARAAAARRHGAVLAPPVLRSAAGRPVLSTVPGPRLDERLAGLPTGRQPHPLLVACGTLLARLHNRQPPINRAPATLALPWTPLALEHWLGRSAAQRAVVAELAGRSDLRAATATVTEALAGGATWLHGDARVDNICVTADQRPLLIDWELSGVGRPERDAGTLCASIATAVLGVAVLGATDPDQARAELRRALGRVRTLAGAVLAGYRATANQPLRAELLAGATGLALLSTTWARCGQLPLDRRNRALLQLATTLLANPKSWGRIDAHAA